MARNSKSFLSKDKTINKYCYLVKKSRKIRKNFKNRELREKVKILQNIEPAGLEHVKILSKHLKRPINIWSKKDVLIDFGKYFKKPEINLEFIKSPRSKIGHFTSTGACETYRDKSYPNNCLFNAVGAQVGIEANVLRRKVQYVQRKEPKIRCKSASFPFLPYSTGQRHCSNNNKFRYISMTYIYIVTHFIFRKYIRLILFWSLRIADLIGGAAYYGKSKKDAKKILDSSQKGQSHPDMRSGHPRGHASDPKAKGYEDSVENYSKYGRKTGFLSRSDQDQVAHLILKTSQARDAMEILNHLGERANKEAVNVYPKHLQIDEDKLPLVQEWLSGEREGKPDKINELVMVLKHFYEKHDVDDEEPFVLTCYPKI